MYVDERCLGVEPTPELKALVRTVFERTLDKADDRISRVQVRLTPDGAGVACRVCLHLLTGPPLISVETRASLVDAVLASAGSLSRALGRQDAVRHRRQRRHRSHGGARAARRI